MYGLGRRLLRDGHTRQARCRDARAFCWEARFLPRMGTERMGSHCFAGRMLASRPLDESLWMQAKAYSNGFIHPVHHRAIYPAHVLPQTLFVQRPDLF